jgi:hypothetical protein
MTHALRTFLLRAALASLALTFLAAAASAQPQASAPPSAGQASGSQAPPQAKPATGEQPKPAPGQAAKPANEPVKAAADQAPSLEPDAKALRDASSVTDSDKQIEALRKLIADFPESPVVASAQSMIFSALARKVTNDIKALQEEAKTFAAGGATPNEQARRLNQAANGLAGAGVLLDEAEEYTKKALGLLGDEKAWIAAEKKAAAEADARARKKDPSAKPRPETSDADYSSRFVSLRQANLTTLAQILEKKGKPAEAEKAYRDAYALQPKTGGAAALKLAEYAKASGHPFEQLEYLTVATLAGRVAADSRAELEALYKTTRGGSPADLDRMLDERYEKEAVRVEAPPYKPSKSRTDRVVLAELFTGAGCPPCVGADLALDGALERYLQRDLALLVYHEHIPRPDPMTNPSTQARKEYYDVPGTPTYFIDGGSRHVGGGAASGAQKLFDETIRPVVDKRLDVKPGADISLKAAMVGGQIKVTAKVGKILRAGGIGKADKAAAETNPGAGGKTQPVKAAGRKLRLQIALVEEIVHYTGENGVRFHPMVVRSLAASKKNDLGFVLPDGKSTRLTHEFDIARVVAEAKAHLDDMEGGSSKRFGKFSFIQRKNGIDASRLRIVAFVQDEATREVLQAASVVVKAAGTPVAKAH